MARRATRRWTSSPSRRCRRSSATTARARRRSRSSRRSRSRSTSPGRPTSRAATRSASARSSSARARRSRAARSSTRGVSDLLARPPRRKGSGTTSRCLASRTHTDADDLHISRGGVPDRPRLDPAPLHALAGRALLARRPRGRDRARRRVRAAAHARDQLPALSVPAAPVKPRSVIVAAVRTPFGRLGGGLAAHSATELGAIAIRAALERAGIEPRRAAVRDHGPGAPGRRRPGSRAAGGDRRRAADGDAGGHDQQGLRVVDPRGRDRRLDDPRRRRRARRHRRHGVDVERAVRPREGALRLPARGRDADRPDDARRADLDLRRAAHGRAGVVRLARARDLARGAGRVGVPLASSARSRRRTRAASRTRSSASASSRPTRARAATRRSRSSPRSSR